MKYNELRICLDAGHGNKQNYANNYYESEGNLEACKMLKEELEKYKNVVVFMTRTEHNQNPSLEARGKLAVDKNCQVFYSWHSDANSNVNTRGVTVIRSLKRPDSYTLGAMLASEISYAMGTPLSPYSGNINGVWTRPYPNTVNTDYYGVIREAVKGASVEYAFLVEHGFHTNLLDVAQLDSAVNRRKIVQAEARAFADYFDLELKEEFAPPEIALPDYEALYRLEVERNNRLVSALDALEIDYAELRIDFQDNMDAYAKNLAFKTAEIAELEQEIKEAHAMAAEEIEGMQAQLDGKDELISELLREIAELGKGGRYSGKQKP